MNISRWFAGRIGDWVFAVLGVLLVLVALLFSYAYQQTGATPERSDEVAKFVGTFGKQFESVPLDGPRKEAIAAMDALYTPYVSPALLELWKADPSKAPGRHGSNPRIVGLQVSSVQNVGVGTYVVKAYTIVETKTATTTEKDEGDSVILGVIRLGTGWQVVEYQKRTP